MVAFKYGDRLRVLRGERQGETGKVILVERRLYVLKMDKDDEEMAFGIGDLEKPSGSGLNIPYRR